MEAEGVLEKLRRLRYQSDYPLRLFLMAMGNDNGWGEPCGKSREGRKEPAPPRRQGPGARWRLRWGRCPHCGHDARSLLRRRERTN